jgi:hypothetical protein
MQSMQCIAVKQDDASAGAHAGRARLAVAIAAAAMAMLPTLAAAKTPKEFLGKWSNNPPRCEQVNGEVDVLNVIDSGFEFYEIGCELHRPRRGPNGTTFAAQCYKGGSPWHSAKVILRRFGGNKISVRILNFPWVSSDPDTFERCKGE